MGTDTISRIQKKYWESAIPWSVHFELTYRCNLRCSHCYIVPDNNNPELSLSEIKKIMEELVQIGTIALTLSGGEIFLRKDILDILDFAAKRFYVFLLTNGTLMTEKIAWRLKKSGVLRVEVSLYGKKEIHDMITRTPGSFDKAMDSLNWLKKAKVPVTLKCLALKDNLEQYAYLKEIAEHFGARYKPGFLIYPRVDGTQEPCDFRIPKGYEDCFSNWLPEIQDEKSDTKAKTHRSFPRNGICNAGRIFCSITSYGDVHPCVMLPWNLGNLRERSFRSLWQEDACKEIKMLRSLSITDLLKCSQCEVLGFCVPCIGLNYLENNDIFKCSTEYCRLACWLHSRQSHPKGGKGHEATLRQAHHQDCRHES